MAKFFKWITIRDHTFHHSSQGTKHHMHMLLISPEKCLYRNTRGPFLCEIPQNELACVQIPDESSIVYKITQKSNDLPQNKLFISLKVIFNTCTARMLHCAGTAKWLFSCKDYIAVKSTCHVYVFCHIYYYY